MERDAGHRGARGTRIHPSRFQARRPTLVFRPPLFPAGFQSASPEQGSEQGDLVHRRRIRMDGVPGPALVAAEMGCGRRLRDPDRLAHGVFLQGLRQVDRPIDRMRRHRAFPIAVPVEAWICRTPTSGGESRLRIHRVEQTPTHLHHRQIWGLGEDCPRWVLRSPAARGATAPPERCSLNPRLDPSAALRST